MPKTKKAQQIEEEEKVSYREPEEDETLEQENERLDKTDFTDLIKQCQGEYKLSWDFMKPKLEEWAVRLKLYNNQKRDKEAIGDPLMFTVHQTVLASLYSDRLTSEFSGREEGDEEVADTLNVLAVFDEDDMQKDILDYEWDWDASFFGRGLCLFMGFDTAKKTPIPEVIDPMTWVRDPKARSVNGDVQGRGAMRFGGREIRLTKKQMKDGKVYFNYKGIKKDGKDINSIIDRNSELRSEAQGFNNPVRDADTIGENEDYRVLEWFTHHKGKKVLVSLAENRTKVIRITQLKDNEWPILDRTIYPMAHDWDGVSIPDLTEDKQRARSVLQNLGLKQAKANLHPMYLYNTTKIKNKADLNFAFNKFIPVDGDVAGAVQPMNKDLVKQEASWILEVLDTAAQRATATPEMQQGVQSEQRRTASEINLVASKVDTRYSLSAKIFGWSEKRFWKQWYRLYKRNFADKIHEKSIRVAGASSSQWRKLTRENIVMSTDPDVKIESKILSEEKRLQNLQMFRAFVKDVLAVAGQQANLRFALKRLGKLSGLMKDEIDQIIPPNVDEMEAEDENEELNENKMVEVDPIDDDMIHMNIHNKASDTEWKAKHIEAHRKNMKLKKQRPELFPQLQQQTDPSQVANIMEKLNGAGGSMPIPGQAGPGGATVPMPTA